MTIRIFELNDTSSVCKIFKTLGNENRLGILSTLLHGEASVGDLEKILRIKQPNLSHELKKLRDIGLVTTRRESKVIFYAIENVQVAKFLSAVLALVSGEEVDISKIGKKDLPALELSSQGTKMLPETRALAHPQRTGEFGKFPVVRH